MSVRWRPAVVSSMLLSLLPFLVAAEQSAGQTQAPAKFRSAVDLVSVSAVVRDLKGRFVSDLAQRDFTVLDAGEPRPILGFRAESDGPVKLALLFDVSGSMRLGSKVVDARQAARHLFGALRPSDEAALFAFDTKLERLTDFTSDFASLEACGLDQAVAQAARRFTEIPRHDERIRLIERARFTMPRVRLAQYSAQQLLHRRS